MATNICIFSGNVGKEPEFRYNAKGQGQCKFSLAVNRNYKGADGEWKEETEWVNVVVWGDLAERVSTKAAKGAHVLVHGRMQTRKWDDDRGEKHYMTEIIANQVEMLSKTEGGERRAPAKEFDDDLPFE